MQNSTLQSISLLFRSTSSLIACVALIVATTASSPSHAVLIATDSFATEAGGADYTVGSILSQNPTVGSSGFSSGWPSGTGAFVAANGGFTHPLSPGTPLNGQINAYTGPLTNPRNLSRAINYTPTDGTYYLSALFNKSAVTNTLDLFAGLGPLQGASTVFASTLSTAIGISNGGIGFLSNGTVTTLLSDAQVNVGETYFALLEINYSTSGTDTVTAYVYNGSSTLAASQVFSGLNLDGNIGRLIFVTNTMDATVSVDEFRFGTQLGDVMLLAPVPEPSTAVLLGLGMVVAARIRRRRPIDTSNTCQN